MFRLKSASERVESSGVYQFPNSFKVRLMMFMNSKSKAVAFRSEIRGRPAHGCRIGRATRRHRTALTADRGEPSLRIEPKPRGNLEVSTRWEDCFEYL